MFRTKPVPPDGFKYVLCKSCGAEVDFTYAVRKCLGCGRSLCKACKWTGRDHKSRCHKCHRAAFQR